MLYHNQYLKIQVNHFYFLLMKQPFQEMKEQRNIIVVQVWKRWMHNYSDTQTFLETEY
jgi:hypothetical protein